MEEEDSKLSLLASIFDYNDDKTEKVAENNNDEEEGNEVNVQRRFDRLKEALRLANGDIEAAVDWLLKKKYKRPSDSSLDPPCIKKHQKHQTNLEHFGIISTSSRINKESLNAKRMSILEQAEVIPENNAFTKLLKNSASSSSIINLTAETVSKHLPAKLILNFFGNSDDLLVEVLKDSLDWKPPKFIIFDQLHTSSHLTAIYSRGGLEAKKEIRADHYEGGGGGGGSTLSGNEEMQTFGPLLENARRITEDFINSYRRQQESYEIHPDETQGPWIAIIQPMLSFFQDVAVANAYRNGQEHVGPHSDKLTYIGPRATIASITLGAERVFRVKRIPGPTNQPPQTFSISLPHNSLLIMLPLFQEHFRHEVPKTKNLRPHPISKDVRINITFRYSRPVYLENNPKCYCGNHSILRTVVKKSNTMGSYFYSCGGKTNSDHSTEQEEEEREIERENGAGQDSQLLLGQKKTSVTVRCDFFQWLDTNHINTLDKQRLLTSQSNP